MAFSSIACQYTCNRISSRLRVNGPTEDRGSESAGAPAVGADRAVWGGGESKTAHCSCFSPCGRKLRRLERAERWCFHLLPTPPDLACGCFLTSTLKCVLSENTLRKCLSKQALLSGNPAIISGISGQNTLPRAAGCRRGEPRVSIWDVLALRGGRTFTAAGLCHHLATSHHPPKNPVSLGVQSRLPGALSPEKRRTLTC